MGPHRASERYAVFRSLVVTMLLLGVGAPSKAQQISDDPSDATTGLTFNTNAGISTTLTASCTTGSLNPATGDFSLALAPVAPATSSTAGSYPPCGNFFTPPPNPASPAPDVWFRIDAPVAAHRFRITVISGTMTNGGIAVYEAPNATGPFRLMECATGGSSITLAQNQPAIDAVCYTPGNKLYVRVWDQNARANNLTFRLCVQGQTESTMPPRGASETACTAPTINASASFTNVDYVFACDESPWLFADSGGYVGGDLWLKLTVPPTGVVGMIIARGLAGTANTIGVTAYSATNCGDPLTYRQLGDFHGTLPASTPALPNLTLSCLVPGSTLYVRIHSVRTAQSATLRYGRIRFRWTIGPSPGGTPPSNNLPCGATPLTFGGSCPIGTTPMSTNLDACNTGGIPNPGCGNFDGNSRDVWYSFVAPASGTIHLDVAPYGMSLPGNPAMALYGTGGNGCSGRFTLLECDDRQGLVHGAAIIRTGLMPGETYYVRVWVEGTGSPVGQFTICLTEPTPPAGTCFYVMELWAANPPAADTYQGVQYEINGGAPVILQTPLGGEASEIYLIPVPTGGQLHIQYFNQNVGNYIYALYQLGDTTQVWQYHGGIPVFGPHPSPVYQHTVTSACNILTAPVTDCLGAETVCTPNTEVGNLRGAVSPGIRMDLDATNMGCLSAPEDGGIAWLIFRPTEDGTVAFWFDATANAPTTDLDFAIWDAGPVIYTPSLPNIDGSICAPNSPPVRCTSARLNQSTGLMPGLEGVYQEGTGGTGWLSPLPVLQEHVYLVALVRASGPIANVSYQMRWTQYTNSLGATSTTMLGCTSMILPVELLLLEATPTEGTVELHWATGSERNSDHFVVERSRNGKEFEAIGTVDAAGSSSQRIDYLFVDPAPFQGANYYRLRQVDQDHHEDMSNIVVAMFGGSSHLLLFPNPTTGELFLTLPPTKAEGPMMIGITDVMGRLVHTRTIAAGVGSALSISTDELPSGAYLLSVADQSGHYMESTRFVKQ